MRGILFFGTHSLLLFCSCLPSFPPVISLFIVYEIHKTIYYTLCWLVGAPHPPPPSICPEWRMEELIYLRYRYATTIRSIIIPPSSSPRIYSSLLPTIRFIMNTPFWCMMVHVFRRITQVSTYYYYYHYRPFFGFVPTGCVNKHAPCRLCRSFFLPCLLVSVRNVMGVYLGIRWILKAERVPQCRWYIAGS